MKQSMGPLAKNSQQKTAAKTTATGRANSQTYILVKSTVSLRHTYRKIAHLLIPLKN
jgi:hypothetical protein